jgi:hypothetical protein
MTKRRLINKKAYEEMVLLKEMVKGYGEYVVSLEIDENGNEGFKIADSTMEIFGEDYATVSKMFIKHQSDIK